MGSLSSETVFRKYMGDEGPGRWQPWMGLTETLSPSVVPNNGHCAKPALSAAAHWRPYAKPTVTADPLDEWCRNTLPFPCSDHKTPMFGEWTVNTSLRRQSKTNALNHGSSASAKSDYRSHADLMQTADNRAVDVVLREPFSPQYSGMTEITPFQCPNIYDICNASACEGLPFSRRCICKDHPRDFHTSDHSIFGTSCHRHTCDKARQVFDCGFVGEGGVQMTSPNAEAEKLKSMVRAPLQLTAKLSPQTSPKQPACKYSDVSTGTERDRFADSDLGEEPLDISAFLAHVRPVSPTLCELAAHASSLLNDDNGHGFVAPLFPNESGNHWRTAGLGNGTSNSGGGCELCGHGADILRYWGLWRRIGRILKADPLEHQPSHAISCPLFVLLADIPLCTSCQRCSNEIVSFLARNYKETSKTEGFLSLNISTVKILVLSREVLATEQIIFESCMRWAARAQPALSAKELEKLLRMIHYALIPINKLANIAHHPVACRVSSFSAILARSERSRPLKTMPSLGHPGEVRFDISRVVSHHKRSSGSHALRPRPARYQFLAKGYAWELQVVLEPDARSNEPGLGAHIKCLRCEGANGSAHTRSSRKIIKLRTAFQFRIYHACDGTEKTRVCAQTNEAEVDVWNGNDWYGYSDIIREGKLLNLIDRSRSLFISVEIRQAKATFGGTDCIRDNVTVAGTTCVANTR
jgi:hypothetical protein